MSADILMPSVREYMQTSNKEQQSGIEPLRPKNWDEFEDCIREIFNSVQKSRLSDLSVDWQAEKVPHKLRQLESIYPILFRGQKRAHMGLKSSLYRESGADNHDWKMHVGTYHKILFRIYNQFISFANQNVFNGIVLPQDVPIDISSVPRFTCSNTVAFMAYVRHLGFPSPLLDWSVSPYIAAYFAFKDAAPVGEVEILVFVKSTSFSTQESLNKPILETIGPHLLTHERHYRQQCRYTVCFSRENKHTAHYAYDNAAFEERHSSNTQNISKKIIIPAANKKIFLEKLNQMNINEFTLFNTSDALMCKIKSEIDWGNLE